MLSSINEIDLLKLVYAFEVNVNFSPLISVSR